MVRAERDGGGVKLVYVAGKYRSDTEDGVLENIAAARKVGDMIFRLGGFAVVPHVMTIGSEDAQNDAFWLAATLELCRRCDAVVMCLGWRASEGSRDERDAAWDDDIPVFYEEALSGDSRAAEAFKEFLNDG